MKRRNSRGFTLIEVVVALAILGVGMLAVFKTIGDTVHNVDALRDRSLAEWIADNRITEIRVSGEMPSVEETAGEVEFAGRRWHWLTKVSQTQVQGLRRIDVSVRRDDDPENSSIVTLSGFVGATATAAPQANSDWYAEAGDPGDGGEGGEDEGQGGEDLDASDEDEEENPE
ncbi:MAG TPA: type II secretion system minor pseudopilin GspI [Steroidobacteraceae bacterium]|nr:type II secretion system minor pseudopilin GspI [Steroidobacteraceae bacterium]